MTASLSSLSSSLNFTLPDLPLFTQTENYVKVTDDAFEISNVYYKDKTAEIYYVLTEDESGAVYAHAYSEEGDLLPEAEGQALYYRSEGIDELPVTDAISALSASLDVAELTVGDLKENFGIDLLGSGEGIVNELIAADDKINEIADKLDGRIDGIELGDVIDVTADSTPILRALEHTTIAELDGRIQTITLKEVIEIDQTSAPILIALQDTTVTGLGERVKTLTLGEVVNTEDNAILEYLSSSTMENLGGRLNDMPLSTFLNVDEGGSAGNAILDALLKDNGEGPTTISNLTERINALKISRIETAQLLTEELREAYADAKEYDFRFAERQATKDIISGLGSAYQTFLDGYAKALDSYRQAIQAVEQARYDYLVDAESDYQKKLAEVRAQKDKVLEQRKEVAELSEGAAKDAAEAALAAEEATLQTLEAALKLAGDTANAAFGLALSAMNTVENALTELEKTFPEEITTALTESAQQAQDAMNAAKDEAFAKFEEAHKEDIEKALADLQARKQALIDANKAA